MRLVVIGYGGMGSWHCERIKEYNGLKIGEQIEIAGVYDIDQERIKVAKENGFKSYASPNDIWQDKMVDAVLIATPNDMHHQYAIEALKAGKHVVCEKPIAMNSSQAKEMYDLSLKEGLVFEVHQNRRWDDDFLTVKNIVDNKLVGEVYAVESRVTGCNGIPGAWRKEVCHGGGMMLDWGVHLIDQMFQMFPQKADSVYCEYSYIYGEEVDDGFMLTAKLQGGITYRVSVLTDCFRDLPRWQVYGTEGTATINDWAINGGMTTIVKGEDNNVEGIKAGNGMTKTMAPRADNSKQEKPLVIVRSKPFEFYRNFAASIRGQENPYIKKDEVVKVFEFMEACNLSAKLNQVIKDF